MTDNSSPSSSPFVHPSSYKVRNILLAASAISLITYLFLDTLPPSQEAAEGRVKSQTETILYPTPLTAIDYPRLSEMSYLLKSSEKGAYENYNKLCLLATSEPKIGMTIDQARNSTWCFPFSRNVTTTSSGTYVQEVYLKRNYDGRSDSRYSPRQYLYFTNDILTTIQE